MKNVTKNIDPLVLLVSQHGGFKEAFVHMRNKAQKSHKMADLF